VVLALRNRLSDAVYSVLFATGAARWVRRSQAVIFCYHNVVPDELSGTVGDRYLHTSISDFTRQLDFILNTYRVVPVDEILSRLRKGAALTGLAALTFDDGYAGALRHAVPLMRQADVPFTLFPVAEGATHRRPFWWDRFSYLENGQREHFLNSLQGEQAKIEKQSVETGDLPDDALPAGWSELRGVVGPDCTFGVHTMTHRNLSVLSPDEVHWEIAQARDIIASELNLVPTLVSYPYGRTNATVLEQTKRAGFDAGLGLAPNLVQGGVDTFDVPRINVPAGIALASFACWSAGLTLRR
jgi:peptidoglycan/xylan/chitin deacetylase (PgdA/CDA1 family)